jgi:hypothetical protein
MGDPCRFVALAQWIKKNFPNVKTVCDVAGGCGELTVELNKLGYDATTIEPRVKKYKKSIRKAVRKNKLVLPKREQRFFDISIADQYDLIVGLHPDGATKDIAESALLRPVVLVPCCNIGWNDCGDACNLVRDYWRSLEIFWQEDKLEIDGANTILYTY